MENIINTLFGDGLFTNIYFVEENPAVVKTTEIRKVDSEIQKAESTKTYTLDKHRIESEGLLTLNVRSHVKRKFFEALDLNSEKREIKYFDRGLLKNIFTPKNPAEILELAKMGDWIITSDEIIQELSKAADIKHVPCYADIRLVGKIDGVLAYKSSHLKNEAYIGKFDTATPVFNKNLSKDELGHFIEYSLIVNSPIIKATIS